MEVLISGVTMSEREVMELSGECIGWCPYNPDSNCWDDGD